jgi:hypothetical protein
MTGIVSKFSVQPCVTNDHGGAIVHVLFNHISKIFGTYVILAVD